MFPRFIGRGFLGRGPAALQFAAPGMVFKRSCSSFALRSPPLVKPGFERPVGVWLLGTCGMIFSMICIGGYTRRTGSGLSMTNWTFKGRWLPRDEDEWSREFEEYKTYPEYERIHKGLMSLNEFKQIYFVEWFHRTWGRFFGFTFLLPFAYFGYKRALTMNLVGRLSAALTLGASQAFVGWWMVRSGFDAPEHHAPMAETQRPRVSPYRLATHFTTALTLYTAVLWTGLSCLNPIPAAVLTGPTTFAAHSALRRSVLGSGLLVCTTLVSGAFVAGNDAGQAFNTWPLMDGSFVPQEWIDSVKEGKLRPFFEKTALVQFDHRMLAYTSLLSTAGVALHAYTLRHSLAAPVLRLAACLPVAAGMQVTLGVLTLLNCVPTEHAVAHQGWGVMVVTLLTVLGHRLRIPVLK